MKTIESQIQQSCVRWFRYQYPEMRNLLFAIPNGGYRNIATARRMVAEGVIRGVSDLILMIPSKGFHALCVEMKTGKGRQSTYQAHWQTEVEKQGYKYVICRNFDNFKKEIEEYIN